MASHNFHHLYKESLTVDFSKEGERWIQLVADELKKHNPGINGHGLSPTSANDDFPYWHLKMNYHGSDGKEISIPYLLILHGGTTPNGVYVVLQSEADISKTQIDMWLDVINAATLELRKQSAKQFKWEAVIGQVREDGRSEHYSLKSRTKLGTLTLRPSGTSYASTDTNTSPRFNSTSINMTYPIIVNGVASGYDWTEASKEASRNLNSLVGLLSIAWKSTWQIIHSPGPEGPEPLKIPKAEIGMQPMFIHKMWGSRHRRVIPKWLPKAFSKIETDEHVANALNTYHQGLLMQRQHPSFALLAFVSSIETIGRKLNRKAGNKKRFIIGIETVTKTKARAKEIADAYKPRSDTAHEATLHGNEDLFGHVGLPSIFNPEPSDFFAISEVSRIKHVSRKVLLKQLKNL
jgi:hypothetical protein